MCTEKYFKFEKFLGALSYVLKKRHISVPQQILLYFPLKCSSLLDLKRKVRLTVCYALYSVFIITHLQDFLTQNVSIEKLNKSIFFSTKLKPSEQYWNRCLKRAWLMLDLSKIHLGICIPKITNVLPKWAVALIQTCNSVYVGFSLCPIEIDVNLRWPKLAWNCSVWSPLFSNNPSN